MKDAVLTIRVKGATRRKLERLALAEGRSLSQLAERFLEQGLAGASTTFERPKTVSLAGLLSGGVVPTLEDFRDVRDEISSSLQRRAAGRRRR